MTGGTLTDTGSERDLTGYTMLISGGSRGIGLAVARQFAAAGGNVAMLAKTDQPHPTLPGTIHTAVAEIEDQGGKAIGIVGDVRNDADIAEAVEKAVTAFGGIDVVVNNASVLNTSGTLDLPMKRFDLMMGVNVRGTFALTRAALPELLRHGGHVVTLAPPLNLSRRWLGEHPGYMLAKYGMSLAAMGIAAEFADRKISSNCVWPQSLIATSAVRNLYGGDEALARARDPQIMADAVLALVSHEPGEITGQTFLDVEVLGQHGIRDLSGYGASEGIGFDIFVDPDHADPDHADPDHAAGDRPDRADSGTRVSA